MYYFKKNIVFFICALFCFNLYAQESVTSPSSVSAKSAWVKDEEGDDIIELENKVYKRIEEIATIKGPTLYDKHKMDPILRNKITEELQNSDVELVDYVIVQGDSLQLIAQKLYNSKARWKEIYLLNKEFLTKNKLKVGLILKVKEK